MLQEAGELAAAEHAGLIDHQHGAGVQPLVSSVEVAQELVAGGHVLEPFSLQAQGGDPGRGRGQEPVAVQLPGVPGDAKGEGLAGPCSPDDQGGQGVALAQVTNHRLLIRADGRVGGQRPPYRVMGNHGRLLVRSAGGALHQLLLDRQQVRGGPVALFQGSVGDHTDRLFG
jgi:hypothetical protein